MLKANELFPNKNSSKTKKVLAQTNYSSTNSIDALSVFGPRPDYTSGIRPSMVVDEFSAIDNALTDTRKQQIKDQISEWQADGIKYGAYFGLQTIESKLDETVDKGLDLDGSVLSIHPITRESQQDYLISSGKLAIDLGSEYIFYDVAWIDAFNSFDTETMEVFNDFLEAHYTSEELTNMGVNDIASFSYKVYLQDHGYTNTESIRNNLPSNNLWKAWVEFYHEFERTFFTILSDTLHNYSQNNYGRELYLGCNRAVHSGNAQWYVADLMDYTLAETFLDDLNYPYHTLSFAYQTSLSLRKRFWSWNFPANTGSLNGTSSNWDQSITKLDQLFTAETFANGGLAQIPMGWVQYLRDSQTVELLIPYYNFALSHPELYNLDNLSEVAILYSEPGESIDPTFKGRSFRGAVGMMEQAHFTFDVVFAGGKYTADNLVLSDLTPYKAILLPDSRYLTDNQVDMLEQYLAQGGILVGVGIIGDQNEKGEFVSRSFTGIFTEGVHAENGGTVIATSEDLFSEHYQAYDGTIDGLTNAAGYLADFETLIGDNISRDIVSGIPNTVHFSRFIDSSDHSQIYHLVNYDYNMDTYEVNSLTDTEISFAVPDGFDSGSLVVSVMTPESTNPEILTASISSGMATFTLPKLNTWAIIKLGSEAAQATVIDNKPQSMMDLDRIYGGHRPDEKNADNEIEYAYWYWKDHTPGESDVIPYIATDDHSLSKVDLYYRYSADEVNWTSWALADTQNYTETESIRGTFTVENLNGEGYYQYKTVAVDDSDQIEAGGFFDELGHGIDETMPETPTPALVTETNGVLNNVGQSSISSPTFIWTLPQDNLSGSLEANIELRKLPSWELVSGKYNAKADDAEFSPGELEYGSYALSMRVADRAGNWSDEETVFTFIYESGSPEIDVQGQGQSIPSGDISPSTSDDTDFGDVEINSGIYTRTFAILNTGNTDLNISGPITISEPAIFSISQPNTTQIPGPSGSVSFDVDCNPITAAEYTATISIPNNDSDENPYTFDVVVRINEESTGIDQLSNDQFNIYPNPTHNLINLNFSNFKVVQLSLENMVGEKLFQKLIVNNEETIDLSHFENGIYFIRIQTENNTISKKIIKL